MKTKKYSEVLANELKRTVPLYILGMFFQSITIYILLLITQTTGTILDMLLQESANNTQIMQELNKLIFYSIIIFIPHSIKRFLYFVVARKSDTKLRKEVYHKLQYVKEEYYENTEKGKMLAYLTKEIPFIRKFLGNFFQSITDLIMTPILVILISANNINMNLAVILFVTIPVTLIIVWKLYQRKQKNVEDARIEYVEMSKVIEQNTSNFTLIKLYNNQKEQKEIFTKENSKMKEKDYQVGKIDALIDNIVNIAEGICYIFSIVYGIVLLTNSQISIGDLSVFTSFIATIFKNFKNRIKEITNGIVYFKQATNRINKIMSIETYIEKGKENIDEIKSIKVKNLNYKYPNTKKYALKDISFEIQKNDKIGIIGMFGSGKTTLMNIISGFYNIKENQVFINDIDINNINKYSLFHNISYILQKETLVNDTIKNNITLETNYEGKSIIQATNQACILEDIFKMENEFEERVGEKGVKLSGGQKQRIAIARNIIADRDFVILDDVFSALDHNTEKEILNNIISKKDKTLIMIANKVTDVANLDKIYLMVDGEFVDSGTHEELLKRNNMYQEMYEYEMAGERID